MPLLEEMTSRAVSSADPRCLVVTTRKRSVKVFIYSIVLQIWPRLPREGKLGQSLHGLFNTP